MATHSWSSLLLAAVTACATATPPSLTAQTSVGANRGPIGKVLVISTSCGSMAALCGSGWAETVDGIVVGSLEFHGFSTIDPATLRKDEATRSESTTGKDSTTEQESTGKSSTVGIAGLLPVATLTKTTGHSVTVSRSKEKTVAVTGATLDELQPEDRQELMRLAGAQSVLTTRLVVGANYSNWTSRQAVEVMVKLSDAQDGTMHFATRCSASSADFPNVDAAIDAAARCAAAAMTPR